MAMDRNLALELVRVTEAAALACARLMGRGDEIAADQAAVDAMRTALNNGRDATAPIVIGEGERDEAPMLYIGEKVGTRQRPEDRDRARPARGHHDPARRAARTRSRSSRRRRTAASCTRPTRTWTRSRSGPIARGAIDIDKSPTREPGRASAQGQGVPRRRT